MYWIDYYIDIVKTGERIKKSYICDSYNEVFNKIVTEKWEGRVKEGDIIESLILPKSCVIDIKEFFADPGKCELYESHLTVKEILDRGFLEGDCHCCEHFYNCPLKNYLKTL